MDTVQAISELKEAVELLAALHVSSATAAGVEDDKKTQYLRHLRELKAHRQVLAAVRTLKDKAVALQLDQFERQYQSILEHLYKDADGTLFSTEAEEDGWFFFNEPAARKLRPILLAQTASLVTTLGLELPEVQLQLLRSAPLSSRSVCTLVNQLSSDIAAWLRSQASVGEESLTDWLLYRLSSLVPWIRYIAFTRLQEGAVTGADWEWWLVGEHRSLGLRVQAKNFNRVTDAYPLLAYSNRYGLQVEKLIQDAQEQNLLPLFAAYAQGYSQRRTLCSASHSEPGRAWRGVFLAGAQTWYDQHVRSGRKKLLPSDLLEESLALSCLFCCGMSEDKPDTYIDQIIALVNKSLRPAAEDAQNQRLGVWNEPPEHVEALLHSDPREVPDWIWREFTDRLGSTRGLLAFDLRRPRGEAQ